MTERVSVILSGPTKINGRFRKAGETVEVEKTRLAELVAAGVIQTGDTKGMPPLVAGGEGYEQALKSMAKLMADAAVAAAVETATAEIAADRDHYRGMNEELEARLRTEEARNNALEAEIEELKGATVDTGSTSAPDTTKSPAPATTAAARKKAATPAT